MSGQMVSMPYMAMRLSRYVERPVIDSTGLAGNFDFKLEARPDDSKDQSSGDFVTGIFESVKELGLELKPAKAPVEVIVIDSVARPTAN